MQQVDSTGSFATGALSCILKKCLLTGDPALHLPASACIIHCTVWCWYVDGCSRDNT